jgi:hypothetical protein
MVGVFIANIMTAAFLWGMSVAGRHTNDSDIPWSAYAALLLPLIAFMLGLYVSSGLPPFLSALAAQ